MKKGIRLIPAILISALAGVSSCTPEEEFSGDAYVEAAFRLESFAAMDDKVTINEAFLKLDRIQTTGSLRGENILDLTHPVSAEEPPYKLSMADSSTVSFVLTSKAYELLDFHLFLFQDNYQLVINTKEDVPPPAGDGSEKGEEDEDNSGNDGEADDNQDGNGDGEDDNGTNGGDDEGNSGDEGDEDEDHGDKDEDDNDGDSDHGDDDEDEGDDEDGEDNDDGNEDDEDKGKEDDDQDKNHDKDKNKNKDKDDDDDGDDRASGTVRTVDLDHFFQNAKPALVVLGMYQNNGVTLNIIFAASGIEKFTVRAKQNDSFTIALDERNSAEVTFDPERWFESLRPADIESASIQTYQQQQVLFIHKDFNTPLYEALVSRIEGSAGLTIRKGSATGF